MEIGKMNCKNNSSCCSPYSVLAQQLEETTERAIQAYNLAAQAFAAVIPPTAGSNIDVTLIAGPSYEIALKNPMDEDVVINADLTVNGDIYQNGSAYESHAEQLYTTKDTVIMRDGATTGLAPGDVAGLIMKLYDGVNDGALVVSNDGTARVGDVGSEQPLLTRDESGSMVNGELLQWNGTGQKAVCSGVNLSQIVRGSGTIGSDDKPVKVVNGVATAVTDSLQKAITITSGTSASVSVPNGVSTLIADPAATTGKYIVTARFSSSGYSSGGGFFINVKGVNYATVSFVSGMTPIATVTCIVEMAGSETIPLRITQYSGATMPFSVEYSLIKIA